MPQARLVEMRRALERALERGAAALERGASALDAVVDAVSVLEDSPVFNAGHGAVLRSDGSARLDASVMLGDGERAGAVTQLRTVQNPARLAQRVLLRGTEVLLAGADADDFARAEGLATHPPEHFVTDYRREQLARLRAQRAGMALDHDIATSGSPPPPARGPDEEGQTVGAVALDAQGHLAAATSTGGLTNALPGRVGDSPIIGAGTWASDGVCAVSATGSGEYFIRTAFAHTVYGRMVWAGDDLEAATQHALEHVVRRGGEGGCVAVDAHGRVVLPFTTRAMPRACQLRTGARHVYVLEGAEGRV